MVYIPPHKTVSRIDVDTRVLCFQLDKTQCAAIDTARHKQVAYRLSFSVCALILTHLTKTIHASRCTAVFLSFWLLKPCL